MAKNREIENTESFKSKADKREKYKKSRKNKTIDFDDPLWDSGSEDESRPTPKQDVTEELPPAKRRRGPISAAAAAAAAAAPTTSGSDASGSGSGGDDDDEASGDADSADSGNDEFETRAGADSDSDSEVDDAASTKPVESDFARAMGLALNTNLGGKSGTVLALRATQLSKDEQKFKQEKKERRQRLLKRHLLENKDHIEPAVGEKERLLQKLATRGVVQLFNAITRQRKAESIQDPSLAKFGAELKAEKLSKEKFLDLLDSATAPSEKSKKVLPSKRKADARSSRRFDDDDDDDDDDDGPAGNGGQRPPQWDVLKDDFMLGARLKDWDKKSAGDDDSSSL